MNTIISKFELTDRTVHLVLENVIFLVYDKKEMGVNIAVGVDSDGALKSVKFTGDDAAIVMDYFDAIVPSCGVQMPGLKPVPDFLWMDSGNFISVFNFAYIAALIESVVDNEELITIQFTLGIEPFTTKKTDEILDFLDTRTLKFTSKLD
jgi:hypothetical protein